MSSAHRSRWSATTWWSGRPAARSPGRATAWFTCSTPMTRARRSATCWRPSRSPIPSALNHAQFGAAVGATDTNILVGAPGNDGGTGEVYEFEGDTDPGELRQPAARHHEPNVTSRPRTFGAAVAGIGNNVIVGAPTVDLAGATGARLPVRRHDRLSDHVDRQPRPVDDDWFWLGGGICRAQHPDRLAGRQHGGARMLVRRSSTTRQRPRSQEFVQPDGGGGNFGASVAGTQNTALIGAPGAFLGTSDAGAAYLFDADPSSPTFGNAIAAVQEPTPTSGDAFGTSVGFDTGALIVGAAGAIGSGVTGAEAVDLYQPGAQLSVSSVTTYLAPAPYDSVIVSGTFTDANPAANLTATIDWGDGSAPTVVDLPAGSYAFAAPHDYTTDPASGSYSIGVTLSDAFGKTAFAQTTIAINNPAPDFASPGLVLSSTSIVEGGAVNVSGTIVSPDGIDTNTVALNWGDGSAPTTIVLPAGQDTFSTSHTYLNNPAGVGSENYTIIASATNQYDEAGYASAIVTVNKVAPQFTAADLSLSQPTANEGDTITLERPVHRPGRAQLVHRDDRLGRWLDCRPSSASLTARSSRRPRRGSSPTRPLIST